MNEPLRQQFADFIHLSNGLASATPISVVMYALLGLLLISVLLAVLCWYLLPLKFRQPRIPVLALLISLGFFIPVLGILGLLSALLLGLYWQRVQQAEHFSSLYLPEFEVLSREPEVKFGVGGIKACMDNNAMPAARRLKALLTMQSVAPRTSNPLLQGLLNDPGEDVRLVAYGLLDGREKKINQLIQEEQLRLASNQSEAVNLMSLRHLAELEWELVYTYLAQGDLRKRALSQSLFYIEKALAIDPAQPGMFFLQGRIALDQGHHMQAERCFQQAQQLGFTVTRLYPYYAEIAFAQRKFDLVEQFILLLSTERNAARMKPLVDYWTAKNLSSDVIKLESK